MVEVFPLIYVQGAHHMLGTWLEGSRKEQDERVWATPTCYGV